MELNFKGFLLRKGRLKRNVNQNFTEGSWDKERKGAKEAKTHRGKDKRFRAFYAKA